ncbi:hypothetical protein [Streptomyces goshikiensis]|uniref:hypothetical protein n=1 Tax=Streptomyces goshikiensis TaxID=1942 RepID=UPI0037993086
MPTTTTADLEDEHVFEQYGHPLAELVSERYTVQEVLKDRYRRPATPQATPAPTRTPDPRAAEHYAVLEAAIANWTYRPGKR